jgi:hypothetical protein
MSPLSILLQHAGKLFIVICSATHTLQLIWRPGHPDRYTWHLSSLCYAWTAVPWIQIWPITTACLHKTNLHHFPLLEMTRAPYFLLAHVSLREDAEVWKSVDRLSSGDSRSWTAPSWSNRRVLMLAPNLRECMSERNHAHACYGGAHLIERTS